MKIGLIPVSAKPYHAGHHALVTRAAGENDQVILYVSTSDRKRKGQIPILGADMQRVWQEELEPIMPGNVSIEYGGSPVRNVYVELERADQANSDDVYVVYSDPVDTARNYPEPNRMKNFGDLYSRGNVLFAAEEDPAAFTRGVGTPDVSGTAMRAALESCDIEAFRAGMPPGVDAENIRNILCPGVQERTLRNYVHAILVG
jgi:hypothetical protein